MLRAAASRLPGLPEGSTSSKDRSNSMSSPAARPGVTQRVRISGPKTLLPSPAPGVSPAGFTAPLGQPLGLADPALAALGQSELRFGSRAQRECAGVPPPTADVCHGTSRRWEEFTGKPQGMGVSSPSS